MSRLRLFFASITALSFSGCVMWTHEYALMMKGTPESSHVMLQKVDHSFHCSAHAFACTNWILPINLWLPIAPRGRQIYDAATIRISSSDQSEPYRKYLLPFQSGQVIVDITVKVLVVDAMCGDTTCSLNGKYALHLDGYVPPRGGGPLTMRSSEP